MLVVTDNAGTDDGLGVFQDGFSWMTNIVETRDEGRGTKDKGRGAWDDFVSRPKLVRTVMPLLQGTKQSQRLT